MFFLLYIAALVYQASMVCMDAADFADYTEADENGYTVREHR